MALNVIAPFKRGGAFPIDETLVLTKAQMLAINDNAMPEKYFCICVEDGNLYLYDKNATPNTETGKYSVFSGDSATDDYEGLTNKPSINGVTLSGEKSIEDLGVETLTNTQILEIFRRVF